MRRHILGLMSLLPLVAVAQIQWISKVHDFGAFDEDTKHKTAYFSFVNTTDEPVSIISATATCGCTVPKYDTKPVEVGDTAIIEVSYDPSGRPGRFEKQIYVRTSDTQERTKLVIKGTVIGNAVTINGRYPVSMGDLKLRNGAAMMGRATAGQGKAYYMDGYNMSNDTIEPIMTAGPAYIQLKSTPERVAPGEMMSLDIYFDGSRCNQWGIVTDSVMIAPALGLQSYSLPTIVIVEEDFSNMTDEQRAKAPIAALSADRIDMGQVDSDEVSGSVKITNRGKSPLIIRRVYTQDPGVKIDAPISEVGKGKSAEIKVTLVPKAQTGDIVNARVTVITNDPDNPTQIVRVVAERKPKP